MDQDNKLKLGDILIYKESRGFYLAHRTWDGWVIFEFPEARHSAHNIAGFDYMREGGHDAY